jgi:lipoprotein signal peptidase
VIGHIVLVRATAKETTMSRESTTVLVSSALAARDDKQAHRVAVIVILVVAVVADQVTKGWAWRHAPEARINFGGNAFVGDTVSAWYADPVTGALLDFAGFGLLSAAVVVLVRRRHPVMILISGALMTGGWISNLFDRLGMHHWTAPGSVRGAVDFIPLGWFHYNVADVFIACGSLLFLVAMGVLATNRSAMAGSWAPMPHGRRHGGGLPHRPRRVRRRQLRRGDRTAVDAERDRRRAGPVTPTLHKGRW